MSGLERRITNTTFTAANPEPAEHIGAVTSQISRDTTTTRPLQTLTLGQSPPPAPNYQTLHGFGRIAGFTLLAYFKDRADHEFLLHVARKMDIPPDHAEAVIRFMHWGKPPPPTKEAGDPVVVLRQFRKRAEEFFREEVERVEGEVLGVSRGRLQGVYKRVWSRTESEGSWHEMETFSETRVDKDKW